MLEAKVVRRYGLGNDFCRIYDKINSGVLGEDLHNKLKSFMIDSYESSKIQILVKFFYRLHSVGELRLTINDNLEHLKKLEYFYRVIMLTIESLENMLESYDFYNEGSEEYSSEEDLFEEI